MQLSIFDYTIIIVFFIGSVLAGLAVKQKSQKGALSFLLADKNVSLPVFIMTNVATWYGGILGVGEFTYQFGLLNWFTQGLPYYLFAILYALLLVGKIKKRESYTIPALIRNSYGEKYALLSSLFIFVLTSPAPYILMTAYIFIHVFQISIYLAVPVVCLITLVYLLRGGYKSDLTTDIYFFFIMFIGFALVIGYFAYVYGGLEFLRAKLPEKHLSMKGGAGWGYIIVWYLIAVWTFADPGFFQRVQSARSVRVAKYGILLSVVLWFVFDFLTNGIGLYARALMPNLSHSADAYLQLADQYVPHGLRGIFYMGMFATILSTLNSFFFISAVTFSQDILQPVKKLFGGLSEKSTETNDVVTSIKYGLIITGVLGGILAIYIPSVISLWYTIGSLCIPPLIFILLSVYYPSLQISQSAAFAESVLTFTAGSLWWAARAGNLLSGFLAEIEPMIAALVIAFIWHLLSLLKEKYYNIFYKRFSN